MADLNITIEIPPESQAKLTKLQALPDEIPQAIKRGMDSGLRFVRGKIQTDHLSGKGPFPPAEHRLGERSGTLREALRETPAVIQGDTVTGEIGWYHPYGRIHEFGKLIRGKPVMRFQIDGQWIMARTVIIPNRAPVRFGAFDNKELITAEITAEINKSLEKIEAG